MRVMMRITQCPIISFQQQAIYFSTVYVKLLIMQLKTNRRYVNVYFTATLHGDTFWTNEILLWAGLPSTPPMKFTS